MRRVDSLEKTLMLGEIGGRKRRGQQRIRWLDKTSLSIWNFMVHILLKPGLENFEHYFTSV